MKGKTSLISHAKTGIAFEYGHDNDPKTITNTVSGIKALLCHLGLITHKQNRKRKTRYFDIQGELKKPSGFNLSKEVRNFKLVKKGEIIARNGVASLTAHFDFTPVLFREKSYDTIFGFMGVEVFHTPSCTSF